MLQVHCGQEQPRMQTEVVGHSLVRLLVCSHHSLVRLLRTARFARALHCAHLFAHFAHSFARGKVGILMFQNQAVLNHSATVMKTLMMIKTTTTKHL